MSLSAPNDPPGQFPRNASGKTPPPAPSSLFAKRARELQTDDLMSGARYRPPALRAVAPVESPGSAEITPTSTVDSLPPTNYPSSFRRARAGTLPSNVGLAAAQRFGPLSIQGAATTNSTPKEYATDPFSQSATNLSSQLSGLSLSSAAPQRPNLKHSASIASSQATSAATERNVRNRSGSLTMLPGGPTSNSPFGFGLFSSSNWLSNSRGGSFPAVDELRSVTSESAPTDDFDVPTLGYLGLDDNRQAPQPATVTELRAQQQAAIAGSLATARSRANTVSHPFHLSGSLSSGLNAHDEDSGLFDDFDPPSSNYIRPRVDSYDGVRFDRDTYASSSIAKGFKPSQHLNPNAGGLGGRSRAISVGVLDDPSRSLRRSIVNDLDPDDFESDLGPAANIVYNGSAVPTSILRDANKSTTNLNRVAPAVVRFPSGGDVTASRSTSSIYLTPPTNNSRAVSPKAENPTQLQTPSRSLWIGNLDPTFTSEDLIRVFARYGAIESLRLLPEKECGFVNFVDQGDAVRAKEDVLTRLGGMIGMPNQQAVRVGFGKADSAPVAPAKTGPTSTPPTGTAAANTLHLKTASQTSNQPGGMDQLQTSPTRALWIGSIPSTTTPATILSVFSPFGPIESARVLTHKNCGFINFERLDDAVRARKALNGRDVLGSDVGAIRIGFARVPVKNGVPDGTNPEEAANAGVQGIADLSVGASIHALRAVKGASVMAADQQILSGSVENYRSNLLLSMIGSGAVQRVTETYSPSSITEQQMIMRELSGGSPDCEPEIQALADFRPPTMYYTTIPLVTERPNNRRYDASKLRELRKRVDSGSMTTEETDEVANDFLDGEIVDLASDWLGNTVVQKLFEKCSPGPRMAMLERIAPHLAMIGIHKNGTWAAQKIIECVSTPQEIALIAQNLRPYTPPLLLDQFGNYVVQCCLRFGAPDNDFIFDALVDRLWEVAQGRFGARSMRACLESPHVTLNQQRRLATAVILNSIPLATNPNGALLLTWLLDTSNFPSRYKLLAPRFTPHLSHLCTHKLASLTVLRLVNQKVEPEASTQVIQGLFSSPNDSVLTDVLTDQVNGVTVVHKVLTSPFLEPPQKQECIAATKRVLIELKGPSTQAYRRLVEEVGLPIPNAQQQGFNNNAPYGSFSDIQQNGSNFAGPQPPAGYGAGDPAMASMMAALRLQAANGSPQGGISPIQPGQSQQLQVNPNYGLHNPENPGRDRMGPNASFSPTSDPFNPFALRSPDMSPLAGPRSTLRGANAPAVMNSSPIQSVPYGPQSPSLAQQAGNMLGMAPQGYAIGPGLLPPHLYQAYYQMYQQQNPQNVGTFP
ncbi:hypothetical protein SISNIDRAFT_480598 [Sistotremastrum niveocremeum HHB9708]|uniref:ARM repeat-containing protein n=2 Tax=Sistotremastraceae TaxID=3402574 RepID=A0A165AHQ0_9AGAM|nr:hypothetical protein SISNIDRAFT_480598 [Sistotremastrum niveocremeum HHB9708]KZT44103.1 hypothetical protein SISSUDRAFT_1057099 [Sistotremastrum suecicum HHB10207 ss-3]